MAEFDEGISGPKPIGKGGSGDLGPIGRPGLIETLEALIAELEGRIRPIEEQIRALRIVVEQEQDSLALDVRRQKRALERARRRPAP
jgi:hypothetical protein